MPTPRVASISPRTKSAAHAGLLVRLFVRHSVVLCLMLAAALGGCAQRRPITDSDINVQPEWTYAIAIHGGAGTIEESKLIGPEREACLESLRAALRLGQRILFDGGSALDACERVVRMLEDDPKFNAGKGAVFTETGGHELDAAVMDGSTLTAGAVAGVRTIKNPITLARHVMTGTSHIMLAGEGAEAFATETIARLGPASGLERVPPTYFDTEFRRKILDEVLEQRRRDAQGKPAASVIPAAPPPRGSALRTASFGTVGCVALDKNGFLAAATSTGGMTAKRWGRIGDSPIIGAGTYANGFCAVSCTGTGEQFIRHTVARDIAALMEYKGLSANAAAEQLVFKTLNPDDGGVIVVSRTGEIAMIFNTQGMYRGAADSSGRFEVGIWKDVTK
jgi:L-asparaginase / beta-aspartyl-peptidase